MELKDLAVVVELLAGDQEVEDLDGLADAAERRRERNAVQVLDHVRPRRAEAEHGTPLRDLVEHRELLRAHGRRARDDAPTVTRLVLGAISVRNGSTDGPQASPVATCS